MTKEESQTLPIGALLFHTSTLFIRQSLGFADKRDAEEREGRAIEGVPIVWAADLRPLTYPVDAEPTKNQITNAQIHWLRCSFLQDAI